MPISVTLYITQNVRLLKVYDRLGSNVPLKTEDQPYGPDQPGQGTTFDSVTSDDCYSPPRGILQVMAEVNVQGQWEPKEGRIPVTDGGTYYWPPAAAAQPPNPGGGGRRAAKKA